MERGAKEEDARKRSGVHVDFSEFKTNYRTNVVGAQKRRLHYLVGAFADDVKRGKKRDENSRHSVPTLERRTRELARDDAPTRTQSAWCTRTVRPTRSPVGFTCVRSNNVFFLRVVFAFQTEPSSQADRIPFHRFSRLSVTDFRAKS